LDSGVGGAGGTGAQFVVQIKVGVIKTRCVAIKKQQNTEKAIKPEEQEHTAPALRIYRSGGSETPSGWWGGGGGACGSVFLGF
jgi:hypothetical protein